MVKVSGMLLVPCTTAIVPAGELRIALTHHSITDGRFLNFVRADFVNNNPPSNLHVLYNTTVTKVVLEPLSKGTTTPVTDPTTSSPAFIATGVEASTLILPTSTPDLSSDTTPSPQRSTKTLKARKEIILSCGSYNSPVVLMHSGIGPKEHIEEVGVEGGCKVDIPTVGSNMEDHMLVFNFYQLNSNMT